MISCLINFAYINRSFAVYDMYILHDIIASFTTGSAHLQPAGRELRDDKGGDGFGRSRMRRRAASRPRWPLIICFIHIYIYIHIYIVNGRSQSTLVRKPLLLRLSVESRQALHEPPGSRGACPPSSGHQAFVRSSSGHLKRPPLLTMALRSPNRFREEQEWHTTAGITFPRNCLISVCCQCFVCSVFMKPLHSATIVCSLLEDCLLIREPVPSQAKCLP